MKAGLIGAWIGGIIGGVLAGSTLVILLVPFGMVLGAIVGFVVMAIVGMGSAEEDARIGYRVVCPSTAELVTVKLDPAKARWGALFGSHQEVTRCSGHWNGPPHCGYPCVKQVAAERTEGKLATEQNHWTLESASRNVVIQATGRTREEALAEAALAITACVRAPNRIRPVETLELTCEGDDDPALLRAWLQTVIRASREHGILLKTFDLQVDGTTLRATARGQKADPDTIQALPSLPEAADAHLEVHEADGRWVMQCSVCPAPASKPAPSAAA